MNPQYLNTSIPVTFRIEEIIDPITKQRTTIRSASTPPNLHFKEKPSTDHVVKIIFSGWIISDSEARYNVSEYSLPENIDLSNENTPKLFSTTRNMFFSHSEERKTIFKSASEPSSPRKRISSPTIKQPKEDLNFFGKNFSDKSFRRSSLESYSLQLISENLEEES